MTDTQIKHGIDSKLALQMGLATNPVSGITDGIVQLLIDELRHP